MKFTISFHICSRFIISNCILGGLAQPGGSNRMNIDSNLEEAESFKREIIKQGETLILKEFPKKINYLNTLLRQPEWKEVNPVNLHEDINIPIPDPKVDEEEPQEKKLKRAINVEIVNLDCSAKVYTFATGMAHSNRKISELTDTVKSLAKQLLEDSDQIELWVSFMIPKIEDGNNFGVSIQEEVLEKVQSVGDEATSIFTLLSKYFIDRSKIVAEIAKYPHVEDYRKAVNEHDEKQYFYLWINLRKIRNAYSLLRDLVIKNLQKLKEPRSSKSDNMYE